MFKKIVVTLLIVLSLAGLIYSQAFAQQKLLKFHSVPATDKGKVACWLTNATTGELYLSSCNTTTATDGVFTTLTATTSTVTGTLTTANMVVTAGATTTCTKIIDVTIKSGIITAATCTT